MFALLLAVAAAIVPVSAPADGATQADKKVCRREALTNSRMHARKVCRSAAEWKAIDEARDRDTRGRTSIDANRAISNR